MTTRIHEFLRNRREDGPCLVVDLDVVRDNYQTLCAGAAGQPRVLRREGEPGAGTAASAGLARLLLRHRLGRRDRDGARGRRARRTASRSATRSRRSATSRGPMQLGVRLFAVDCKAEVEKVARAAPGAKVFCRFLFDCVGAEWPLSRKFGCDPEMAVDVLEHAHRAGLEAYGVSFHVGSQQRHTQAWDEALEVGVGDLPRLRGARHQPVDGQPRRRLPDQVPEGGAGGAELRPVDLPGAAQALRQPHPGDHHRAGSRHGRQCRRDRGRGRAGLEEERARTRCAGSISTSASSAVSPRRWTSRSATRSARRVTATPWRPACWRVRPATRRT